MPRQFIRALVLLLLVTPAFAGDEEVRALWVDSFNPGLRNPAEVDALIAGPSAAI